MIKVVSLGLLYGVLAVSFFMALVSTSDAREGRYRQPNPCRVQWNAMNVAHFSPREMHFHQNSLGCDEGLARKNGNYCDLLARRVGVQWIENGQPILNLTVDKIARGINSRLENEGRGNAQGYDHCTVEEDWSWSWR